MAVAIELPRWVAILLGIFLALGIVWLARALLIR
jgi:hypothetical protein